MEKKLLGISLCLTGAAIIYKIALDKGKEVMQKEFERYLQHLMNIGMVRFANPDTGNDIRNMFEFETILRKVENR